MDRYIGVDLGGTNLRAAIADTCQIFHQRQSPTFAAEGQEAVIQRIIKPIKELCEECGATTPEIKGVGIGVPGTTDIDTGVTQFLPIVTHSNPNRLIRKFMSRRTNDLCLSNNPVR